MKGDEFPLVPQWAHESLMAKLEPGAVERAFGPTVDELGTISRAQLAQVDDLQEAMQRVRHAIYAEEHRMRTEVLPSPPEGWRWRAVLSVTDEDLLTQDHMRVRLVFKLEEV